MRSGWSSTQLPNASTHTTPVPASSVSTASRPLLLRCNWQTRGLASILNYPARMLACNDELIEALDQSSQSFKPQAVLDGSCFGKWIFAIFSGWVGAKPQELLE